MHQGTSAQSLAHVELLEGDFAVLNEPCAADAHDCQRLIERAKLLAEALL